MDTQALVLLVAKGAIETGPRNHVIDRTAMSERIVSAPNLNDSCPVGRFPIYLDAALDFTLVLSLGAPSSVTASPAGPGLVTSDCDRPEFRLLL